MRRGVLWFIGACVLVGTISYFFMLFIMTKDSDQLPPPVAAKPIETEQAQFPADMPVSVDESQKIQPYTKMVYQYYYPDEDVTKEQEDVPPYYLLDLTMEDVQRMYQDWKVLSFSNREVVMRRNMAGKSDERYVVGQKDGYVAVYYEETQNGVSLHEVTDTPISSLPKEDQDRLREGITVYGNDNLCKILGDYGS